MTRAAFVPVGNGHTEDCLTMMKASEHPQYPAHQQRLARYEQLQQAAASWQTMGGPLVANLDIAGQPQQLIWLWTDAVRLARVLAHAITEHNRIIWQDFPFCQRCGGLCCADRTSFSNEWEFSDQVSLLLLALLNQPAVTLPPELDVAPTDCIYRSPQGCVWQPVGRPLPCTMFYCDGSEGRGRKDTSEDERDYEQLVDALESSLVGRLRPTAVGRVFFRLAADTNGSLFWDAEEVALELQAAVEQVFLEAFRQRFLQAGERGP